MISKITTLPANMAGFDLNGELSKEDYINVVFPAVKELEDKFQSINVMAVLNLDFRNLKSGGDWMKEALEELKQLPNWNKVAILSDNFIIKTAITLASGTLPGEYRVFGIYEHNDAVAWLQEGNH